MKANIKHFALTIGMLAAALVPSGAAFAQSAPAPGSGAGDKCNQGVSFLPRWYDGICDPNTGNITSPNDLNKAGGGAGDKTQNTADNFGKWLSIIALNIVEILLFMVGYVSLGFIIFGGFKFMTSGDNSSGTQAARKTITNAVIGLLLSIMSVAIVNFVSGYIR